MDKYGQMSIWDKTMIIASVIILLLFSVLPCMVGIHRMWISFTTFAFYGLFILITLTALTRVPLDISVSDTLFRINTPLRTKIIPLVAIKSIAVVDDSAQLSLRFGSAGYLGWWGRYHFVGHGSVMLYASNLKELVLLKLANGKQYVLSCTDASEMARQVRERLEATLTTPTGSEK